MVKWFTEFRCDRTSTTDAKQSGYPTVVATPLTTEKIHDIECARNRELQRHIASLSVFDFER